MFKEIKTHEITTDVVIFTIKDNKLQVNLTLSRESANGLVGDSLQKGVW